MGMTLRSSKETKSSSELHALVDAPRTRVSKRKPKPSKCRQIEKLPSPVISSPVDLLRYEALGPEVRCRNCGHPWSPSLFGLFRLFQSKQSIQADSLTVHSPANTPSKRVRDESEGEQASAQPLAKRHQSVLAPKAPPNTNSITIQGRSQLTAPFTDPVRRSPSQISKTYPRPYGRPRAIRSIFPPTKEEMEALEAAEIFSQQEQTRPLVEADPPTTERLEAEIPSIVQTPRGGLFGTVQTGFGSLTRSISKIFRHPAVAVASQLQSIPDQLQGPYATADTDNVENRSESRRQRAKANPQQDAPPRRNVDLTPKRALTSAELEENLRRYEREIQAKVDADIARELDGKSSTSPKTARNGILGESSQSTTKMVTDNISSELPRSTGLVGRTTLFSNNSSQPSPLRRQAEMAQKRKRLPTGQDGKIPPPSGATYGLDVRYIDVDYDSEGSIDPDSIADISSARTHKKQKFNGPRTPRSVLKKRTDEFNATITRSAKHVTFDESPLNTPSKIKARTTDPYTGIHFADRVTSYSQDSPSEDSSMFSPNTKANTRTNEDAGFTPSTGHPKPGQFCLDYDTYEELDEDGDIPMQGLTYCGTMIVPIGPAAPATGSSPMTPHTADPELPTNTTATPTPATTTSLPPANTLSSMKSTDNFKVLKVGNAPSAADDRNSNNLAKSGQIDRVAQLTSDQENAAIKESDEWAASLDWPEPQTYVEAGIASQEIVDLVNENWTQEDDEMSAIVWEREFNRFLKAEQEARERGVELVIE